MKGLPYRCSYGEIKDFFKAFEYLQDSVEFGIGADGRSSGVGMILFANEQEAEMAVKDLNREYIGQRFIILE